MKRKIDKFIVKRYFRTKNSERYLIFYSEENYVDIIENEDISLNMDNLTVQYDISFLEENKAKTTIIDLVELSKDSIDTIITHMHRAYFPWIEENEIFIYSGKFQNAIKRTWNPKNN